MAEAAKKNDEEKKVESEGEESSGTSSKNSLFMGLLLLVNTLCLLGVGFGLFMFINKLDKATEQHTVVSKEDLQTPQDREAKIISLEPLIVNLSGSEGYKLLKVTMSLEVENPEVQDEISSRQAQVMDIILVLISSKTYGEISGDDAKRQLKEDIMDTVNSILTKGRIRKILFTEFIFN